MKNEFNEKKFMDTLIGELQIPLAGLNQEADNSILSNFLKYYIKIEHRINASNNKEYIKKQILLIRTEWDSIPFHDILNTESLKNKAKKVNLALTTLELMLK